MRPRTIVLLSAVAVVAFGLSCASIARELRSGWARVEFVDGQFHDAVVCSMATDRSGDISARCISLEDFAQLMAENGLLEQHEPGKRRFDL